jgi:superfamily II DNA or RNA helicase
MDLSSALRPYQAAAVAAVSAHWESGRRRVVCALPTGAGKTTVAAACLEAARARRPPLALVHTRTLLAQTRRRLGPGVVVRTIQAVLRAGARLDHDVVFLDECHHLASRSWVRVLSLLPPGVRIIGCTATPARADGAALGTDGAGFDALVSTAPYSTLLRLGHLAPCRVVRTEPGLSSAAAYLAHGERRPGILFAPSIAACETAATALRSAGVRAATITAATGARARRAAFAAYEAGALDVLASPMALSEGFDSPRAAVCVLDRTCVHHGVYLQTAGRILRPHATKDPLAGGRPAVLIDMHGASERHGHPLADRQYRLEGDPIRLEGPPTPAPAPARRDAPRPVAPRPPSPARPARRAPVEQVGFRAGSALARAGSWVTSFFLYSMGAR